MRAFPALLVWALLPFANRVGAVSADSHPGVIVSNDPPWFCHSLDCPHFDLLAVFDKVEKRVYAEGKWASTLVQDVTYDKAVTAGFYRLFDYISGANVEKKKIEMTAPVKVEVTPSQGPFCKSTFKVSFFVPYALQDSAPEPSSPDVFIETMEETTFYVSSYGGWSSETKVLDAAERMIDTLEAKSLQFNATTFYSAGYDSPFRLTHRHNEVWIPA